MASLSHWGMFLIDEWHGQDYISAKFCAHKPQSRKVLMTGSFMPNFDKNGMAADKKCPNIANISEW